ncbi:PucR family transcriptional regulator [Clostridium septicum]|uniref:Helix-turn-helix domain-containing protein n=1 Tax=Clostridium septicum TaxID=1504 RepID=A0A9N7JK66_CLOSE|nr:helix-turn-helix domain-containing protein [Clostridium septicum]AYE33560.1 PucR family transcriptional regulator [Clostridium septicum]MDU1314865.1 helix-turn-helix domain-containing protein [Clostridium septicum]QAS61723.1 PucR family transcriptional regulator [Clostridium septicum]UEC21832.1 helix-turn-helix domain-containing protein [Clostridium septicum]USS00116.1 helix-turn-helix domain-containing protein [Clostridium septicum]
MDNLKNLLKELCDKTNIKYRLTNDKGEEIFNNLNLDLDIIIKNININNGIYKIYIKRENEILIPFIEFSLDKFIEKNNSIQLLLEGEKPWDSFKETLLFRKGKLFIIDCNNKGEALKVIKNSYCQEDVFIEEVYEQIILVGDLEEEIEHGLSLRESIIQNTGEKVFISVSNLDGTHKGFLKGYRKATEAIKTGKALKIVPEVYISKDMEIENTIYNLKNQYSKSLKSEYDNICKSLNHELILTIEEILRCNFSLTQAAKNLYIHRNTLIYRIEKIKKETSYDIRNFKEATFLYILYVNSKRID